MCSFSHDDIRSINLWAFDRAVVSQLRQITVPTVRSQRVLYQSLGSEELSLPRGFLSEMFHNCGRGEHVQTQAAVRFVEN